MRLALLSLAVLLPACTEPPPLSAPDRGPITLTTWSNGAVAGDLPVFVADGDGELRAELRSDAAGALTAVVGDGWSVTVVDDSAGLTHITTIAGVTPGDALDLGVRRPLDAATPAEIAIAPLAPVESARSYRVEVCGPMTTRTPVAAQTATTAYYQPGALDDDGGALLIARAGEHIAVVDAPDLAAIPQPITFPPWQSARTDESWYVAAPAGAIALELRLDGPHGCGVGRGEGAAGERVTTSRLPDLPVDAIAATAWFTREGETESLAMRRLAVVELAEPAVDLADAPTRITDVGIATAGARAAIRWTERSATSDGRGDGLAITLAPSPDSVWSITAPHGDTTLPLPALPDLDATRPVWLRVTLVERDDLDGFADLAGEAGLPVTHGFGWFTTGATAR
jgi:hypothetical protein